MEQIEKVLYGWKDSQRAYEEDILSTRPENFEKAKELAKKDGYTHFRIGHIDLRDIPDFAKTLSI